jgi:hypothetical protein
MMAMKVVGKKIVSACWAISHSQISQLIHSQETTRKSFGALPPGSGDNSTVKS